ncbi:hypothetical protein ACFE04_009281 [Oxalis oulophora]
MTDINPTTTTTTTTTTTSSITTLSYDKLNGLATWFGTNVAYAFFTSLERCSCINLSTSDEDDDDNDDDDDEAHDRPLMLPNFSSSVKSADFAVNNDNDNVLLPV